MAALWRPRAVPTEVTSANILTRTLESALPSQMRTERRLSQICYVTATEDAALVGLAAGRASLRRD